MGIPNIQQQLYLKRALNENTDGMFDHPEARREESITEGYHKKAMRAAGTPRFWDLENRATASELRRGGASKRTMKKYFNTDDYAAGTRAMQRFEKKARANRNAALGSGAARISTHATKMDAKRKAARIAEDTITEGLLRKIELAEGSIGAGKIGKGKKFSMRKSDKYATKTAVRQLIKTGRDPNLIKIPTTRGIENFGFDVNAAAKRKAALRAKGKKA